MAYRRGLALLCCLLVVVSGTAGVLAAQPPSRTIDQANQASVATPSVLSVSEDRQNFTTPSITVTDTLSIGHHATGQELSISILQARLDAAETEAARTRILTNATDALSEAVDQLATDSRAARQQYREGAISTKEYGNQLAQIDSRAEDLVSTAEAIEERASEDSELVSRAVELRAQLMMYTGPVRDRIATAITEGGSSGQIYIGGGPNGTTSAIIEDGVYVREANRPDQYNSEPGQIPQAEPLLENIRQQYPWVMNQSAGVSFTPLPIDSAGPQYAYWLTLTYPSGEINAYVDTSTQDVYQEVHRIRLDQLEASPDVTIEKTNYVVTVSQSFTGGPLQVNVTAPDGDPVDAEIRVDNSSVGTTGQDGIYWLIEPAGDYTITAVTDDTEIRVVNP
ncbi:DUF7094 domain-containing protein [Halobacterium sp. KA-6]|uniref:DUF7094 domain-containing protein n=1 Tax=Halobacterium sp. KA-6 TaxID=2896368 RepID=UPI003FA61041